MNTQITQTEADAMIAVMEWEAIRETERLAEASKRYDDRTPAPRSDEDLLADPNYVGSYHHY